MEWLKKIRIDNGMTQEEVAQKSGISRQYYAFIESGDRGCPVHTAKKIAETLGFCWQRFYENEISETDSCTVDELLTARERVAAGE